MKDKINIVIPMAGLGSRFKKLSKMPKPLIEIKGMPFFYYAAKSLTKYFDYSKLIFIGLKKHNKNNILIDKIKSFFPNATIKLLDKTPNGAVLTSREAIELIDNDYPVIFNDCDHIFYSEEFTRSKNRLKNFDGFILTFNSNLPIYSYCIKDKKGNVVGTREKEVISEDAIAGVYGFKNIKVFEKASQEYLENCDYSEFYMSGLYNMPTLKKGIIKSYKTNFNISFGTIDELKKAENNNIFYLYNDKIISDNFSILEDLSGMSEANTFLIKNKNDIFIRKIASNGAAKKLKKQYQYIIENKYLKLPKILNKYEENNIFYYDMKYFAKGYTFFNGIYNKKIINPLKIIKNILESLKIYHSNQKTINELDKNKIINNIYEEHILYNINFIKQRKEYKHIANYKYLIVNNQKVPNILNMLNYLKEYHFSINHNIKYIHGDLTIENILVDKNQNYMIIDPAPRYNDLFAEYSKLFQSLHGKYEYIKKITNYKMYRNKIEYNLSETNEYDEIFEYVSNYIIDNYGIGNLQKVYFYEAICYIRAMVYMLKLNKNNAFLMLALSGLAIENFKMLERENLILKYHYKEAA